MTPNERADFLTWLSRLPLEQVREVQGYVSGVITHKRGQVLRDLNLGMQVVVVLHKDFDFLKPGRHVATIIKLFRTGCLVETIQGPRVRVDVDDILGLHTGGGSFAPLAPVSPMPFPPAPPVTQEMQDDVVLPPSDPFPDHVPFPSAEFEPRPDYDSQYPNDGQDGHNTFG